MIIPNKHSGYQAGIRLYPGGGGAGNLGGVNPINSPTTPAPPSGISDALGGGARTYFQQRPDVAAAFNKDSKGMDPNQFVQQHFQQFGKNEGNVTDPTKQFFQPVYQPQYQNYNTGNAMNVSQYGQPAQPQMNWQTGQMTQPAQPVQQPSMFGGQMQGGGYGAYGMNNPFSPYSNSFLNLDPNLNQGTQADKANAYRTAIQNGFGDQQIYNQATGLFGQQSPQAWGYLQGSAMGMNSGLSQGSEQDKAQFYQGARNQGFNDQTIRNAANQMFGNQSQSDWSYLQNQSGYGGGFGGYGNQFMPQMQNPYAQQPAPMARTSSGPSQAIVGRSSQMRGTPNVMRRAEGGITSLMDDVA